MRSSIIASSLAFGLAAAQTFTDCNPTLKTCPSDNALGKTITVDFTKGASDQFTLAQGTTLTYDSTNGANFKITSETQAPTISSAWYIFFGKVEVVTQAAPGVGIVSSFVMESDDLDEIDWEWLGGDFTQVESNYFGKGNTSTYDRAIYHSAFNAQTSSPQTTFHTYTIDWTKDKIVWSIDNSPVRTLNYGDANGGKNFPQTPMRVKMGNWVGGSSTSPAGTVEWAGGKTPFPGTYQMYVKSVTIQDYTTTGSTYTYSDLTGSYSSIVVSGGAGGSSATNTTEQNTSVSAGGTTLSTSTKTSGDSSNTASHLADVPTAVITTKVASNGTTVAISTSTAASTGASSRVSTTSAGGFVQGSATQSASGATGTNAAGSRYGALDISVAALGLGLSYFLM